MLTPGEFVVRAPLALMPGEPKEFEPFVFYNKDGDCVEAVGIALVMAVLHDAAVALFGLGASKLGTLGVSVGYTVFMAFAIMVGNMNGFLTGEWKNAGKKAVTWICVGIAILVVAVCLLGIGKGLDG